MSYRTILVPMGQRDNAQDALEAAFLVARRFAGHVHGLHVPPDLTNPATHALVATRMTAEEAQGDFRRFRASAEHVLRREATELKRLFDEVASRAGAATQAEPSAADQPSAGWQEVTGFESELVGRLGRVFDLTVIARRGPRGSSHDTVQAALLETGRPLLLAPPAAPPRSARGAAGLEREPAGCPCGDQRAALPAARRAGHHHVGGNGPEPEPTTEQLARSLAWHGIAAEVRRIEQGSRRVRDILLSEATALSADLLVLGAYSHSRMRQVVFGGVTEHMLDYAELPVLMTSLGPRRAYASDRPRAHPHGDGSAVRPGGRARGEAPDTAPGIRGSGRSCLYPCCRWRRSSGPTTCSPASTRRASAARSPASSPRNSSTFRPERLVVHELLIRVTADISVPDGPSYEDLGINFRRIAGTILSRYLEPRMPEIRRAYDALRAQALRLIEAELASSLSAPARKPGDQSGAAGSGAPVRPRPEQKQPSAAERQRRGSRTTRARGVAAQGGGRRRSARQGGVRSAGAPCQRDPHPAWPAAR